MSDERPRQRNDPPRNEPEIFPPGTPIRPRRADPFEDVQFAQRIYIRKLGPFSVILLVAAAAIIAVAILALLLGAFLIAIPIVVFMVAAAIIAGLLRPYFRRPS